MISSLHQPPTHARLNQSAVTLRSTLLTVSFVYDTFQLIQLADEDYTIIVLRNRAFTCRVPLKAK